MWWEQDSHHTRTVSPDIFCRILFLLPFRTEMKFVSLFLLITRQTACSHTIHSSKVCSMKSESQGESKVKVKKILSGQPFHETLVKTMVRFLCPRKISQITRPTHNARKSDCNQLTLLAFVRNKKWLKFDIKLLFARDFTTDMMSFYYWRCWRMGLVQVFKLPLMIAFISKTFMIFICNPTIICCSTLRPKWLDSRKHFSPCCNKYQTFRQPQIIGHPVDFYRSSGEPWRRGKVCWKLNFSKGHGK